MFLLAEAKYNSNLFVFSVLVASPLKNLHGRQRKQMMFGFCITRRIFGCCFTRRIFACCFTCKIFACCFTRRIFGCCFNRRTFACCFTRRIFGCCFTCKILVVVSRARSLVVVSRTRSSGVVSRVGSFDVASRVSFLLCNQSLDARKICEVVTLYHTEGTTCTQHRWNYFVFAAIFRCHAKPPPTRSQHRVSMCCRTASFGL